MSEQALDAAAAADAPAAPKSKKMLIIIIAAVVLVGGGAGAFFFLKSSGSEHAGAKDEKAVETKKAPAIYMPLEPPFVVNFQNQEMVRFLQIGVQILTRDAATGEIIKQNDPGIRNDLLLLFDNQEYTTLTSREGKENLRAQALETVRKVIGREGGKPETVEAVLFTSFVMQ
jgi:flagellar FliL protein